METQVSPQRLSDLEEHSDPTYEAWKLNIDLKGLGELIIPILPMRHGNDIPIQRKSTSIPHSDPTYEAWKPHPE